MSEWIDVIKICGPVGTLLCYYIFRDWLANRQLVRREALLSKRLDVLVDIHNALATETIVNNTAALNGVRESNRELRDELRNTCRYPSVPRRDS